MKEDAKAQNIWKVQDWFAVLKNGDRLQAAVMRLEPGKESGDKTNEHPQSEQLLLVVEGEIRAEIGDETFDMKTGDSVIVPTGAAHKFTNPAGNQAITFNVYSPPAY